LVLTKILLGHILGDFFTNASGHPGQHLVEDFCGDDGGVLEGLGAQGLLELEKEFEEPGHEDVVTEPLTADGHRRKLELGGGKCYNITFSVIFLKKLGVFS
jgi:hypothetical protein